VGCGSDLHAKDHADELAEVTAATGYADFMHASTPDVMGHEFSGEVVERGRGAAKEFKPGTSVVSFPLLRAHGGVHMTGLSPLAPGGYAEQVLSESAMTFVAPNGLDQDTAALTEPMAVALHAVRRSDIGKRDVAIVIGCGPVGLAVIFACVGVPGMIDAVLSSAPLAARVVVVGLCMGEDRLRPSMAIGKELDLRFVFGYTPLEFHDTLHMLADGKLDASALVTGTVGLEGVDAAFRALGDPERHAKILIDPSSAAVSV
jgi:threonine dehydrogenase-like Zn-dependent dehydrogenase